MSFLFVFHPSCTCCCASTFPVSEVFTYLIESYVCYISTQCITGYGFLSYVNTRLGNGFPELLLTTHLLLFPPLPAKLSISSGHRLDHKGGRHVTLDERERVRITDVTLD